MATDNKYWYTDEFMYFTFAGVHSSKFNMFLIGGGRSAEMATNTSPDANYTQPLFQGTTYLNGVGQKQKKLVYNCAASGLSLAAIRELTTWLQPGKVGFLWSDYNPGWGHHVVVESVSNINAWSDSPEDHIIEVSIGFATVGSYLASCRWNGSGSISVTPYSMLEGNLRIYESTDDEWEVPWAPTHLETTIGNSLGIPDFDYYSNNNGEKLIRIPHIGNILTHFDYDFDIDDDSNGGKEFELKLNDERLTYTKFTAASTNFLKQLKYSSQHKMLQSSLGLIESDKNYKVLRSEYNMTATIKPIQPYRLKDVDVTINGIPGASILNHLVIVVNPIYANPNGASYLYDINNKPILDIYGNPLTFESWQISNDYPFYVCWVCELPESFYRNYNEGGYNIKRYPLSRFLCGINYYDNLNDIRTNGFRFIRRGIFSEEFGTTFEQIEAHIKNNSKFYVGRYDELLIKDANSNKGMLTTYKHNTL